MRTARVLTVSCSARGGGLPTPRMQILLEADPPRCRPPGSVTCDECWEANPLPPVNRMTSRCKNITLPQTSIGGGNNHMIH